MQVESKTHQFLDSPSALHSDKNKSLICTLKIDNIQYIEDHLCIAGWSTKPLRIYIKKRGQWTEIAVLQRSRPDVEQSIKAKAGSNLGFIGSIKTSHKPKDIQLKFESIETTPRAATIENLTTKQDEIWDGILRTHLEDNNFIKKKQRYDNREKIVGYHPEGHGHLEIARSSRSFEDLVIIGWLSCKQDELFFVELDDKYAVPIGESFRFFRPDIENTGLPASHGKTKEKAGFIIYLNLEKNITKARLCGIHNGKTLIIHEIEPESVNESAANSLEWAKNVVHTSPDEYISRLKLFEIPYELRRIEKISKLQKPNHKANHNNTDNQINVIILASCHWRTKTIISTLEANNSIRTSYTAIFRDQNEACQFKKYTATFLAAYGASINILTTDPLHENSELNSLIAQCATNEILLLNDNINPNQESFLRLSINKIKEQNALAIIPRQLNIYGDEYSAYIEIDNRGDIPKISHKRQFIGRTDDCTNEAFNLDCVIFNREKLLKIGGINLTTCIRSQTPKPISLIELDSTLTTIFPKDIYVTNLRESTSIISTPPTDSDIRALIKLNLI